MNNTNTVRSFGWVIGLILLISLNIQAKDNPHPRHPIQSIDHFNLPTAAVDLPPISLTATVGVPFSATLPRTLPIPPGIPSYSHSVTGLPDNGLIKVGFDPAFIVGTPLVSGVMNLTVTETITASLTINNATTWRAYTITVNPPLPPISLTATVGVPFSATLPRTLPLPGGISTYLLSVTGLPDNGLSRMRADPGFIVGTPLTSGVMNLTVTQTFTASEAVDNATTWRAYIITVNPPLPAISLTATVGVPFSATLPRTLPLPGGISTYLLSVTGLPANGLSRMSAAPGFIVGTPLTSGVMNLTVVESITASQAVDNATTWRAYTLTVNPPLPPISLTATVGVPFSATLLRTLPLPTGISTYLLSVTGLPANGLSRMSAAPGFIVGTPLTSGVMNLTVTETITASEAVDNATTWRAYTLTVNPPLPPISLTATVGVPFSATLLRTLPIPPGTSTYDHSVTGLPDNGLSKVGFDPAFIVGTPLTSGVMNLTVTQTFTASLPINNATTWQAYTITVSAPLLTLLAPTYNCATGAFRFNTSGGDGSPITFFAIGITGPTTTPDQFVDTEQRTASDAPPILLQATQNGTTVTYLWNIRAQCPVGSGPPPVSTLTLLAPTYNCATGAFRFNTSGGDGSPITFFAIGITGPTTIPDQFVDTGLRTASDAPPILLQATQNGATVTYLWNIRAQCPVGSGPPPGGTLTLLAPTYNCATGAFRFNTSGGDGSPITFFAIGITGPTTTPDQFVDTEQRTVNDVQPFLLQATQNGVTVTYLWNLKEACGRARLGEAERQLKVVVLGNPVVGEMVQIEVSGAEGQPLRVALINQQGSPVSEERIMQAAAIERLSIKLGLSTGVQLLQVSSPDQTKVVRVLKTE